jgi:hypothetical protein
MFNILKLPYFTRGRHYFFSLLRGDPILVLAGHKVDFVRSLGAGPDQLSNQMGGPACEGPPILTSHRLILLKIETNPESRVPLAICPRRDEKLGASLLLGIPLRLCRIRRVISKIEVGKINKLRPVTKYGGVENIAELRKRPKPHSLAKPPFSRKAKIESVKARSSSGVSGKIAASRTDRLERELCR